jgi:hypothetical protein
MEMDSKLSPDSIFLDHYTFSLDVKEKAWKQSIIEGKKLYILRLLFLLVGCERGGLEAEHH